MSAVPLIDDLEVSSYRVPTQGPEADGTLEWDATELVVVHLSAGAVHGMGYSYTAATPAAALVREKLAPCVVGRSTEDIPMLWRDMQRTLRNVGVPGLGMMAIAAVDQALWDLRARQLELPLSALWGQLRTSVPAYGSGGFLTYSEEQLEAQLRGWVEQGFAAVKIKLGAEVSDAERRVDLARRAIGPDVSLMVDLNGACDRRGAAAMLARLAPYEIAWVEEPVSSDDLAGLRWLRDLVPSGTAIAAGEYGWDLRYFRRMLEAGAVDVLQADATRCGYTGFLGTAHLCEAFGVGLSAHCAPGIHLPLARAAPVFTHQEYFHDHVRLEAMLFQTNHRVEAGQLQPDEDCIGHGMRLLRSEAEPFRLSP